VGEMGLLSPPLAPSQDQLRKAHRRYRAGGIPGQPSGQSADRVASAPLCPRATPSVRWRYSGQVSIRDPLNDDRQPRTLPTSPVATLVALQGASGDIRARWGGRVLANFAPSAVGQAVQRLACGLDQELPFGLATTCPPTTISPEMSTSSCDGRPISAPIETTSRSSVSHS
jgi:hypothetical protein